MLSTMAGSALEKPVASRLIVRRILQVCAICNDAKIAFSQDTGIYQNVGEPTEAALKTFVEKCQSGDPQFDASLGQMSPGARVSAVNRKFEQEAARKLMFEFSRDRKSMSVLVQEPTSASLLVKGAPDSIFSRCSYLQTSEGKIPLSAALRKSLEAKVLEYGKSGLRTLALARVDNVESNTDHYKTSTSAEYVKFEQDMTFLGLVGMLDPPRPEVRGAIAKCRSAGIRVIVITGDEQNTAQTICRQIGVFTDEESLEGKSLTGRDFDNLSPQDQIQAVLRASLFSRTEPRHKQQIVDLLQGQGLIAAMVCPFICRTDCRSDALCVSRLAMV